MDITAIERAAAVARGPGASQMRAAARMLRAALAAGVDLSGQPSAGKLARDAINGSAGIKRQKQLFDNEASQPKPQESTMTDITFSSAICEAQSVYDIAKRLANAPTENGADGCEAGELSRNQLLGQHAYHYCMDSDSPIAADDFAKFPGDFSAYLTAKLSDFVRIAVEDLENEANDAAQHDEYPLSRADIAQLNESVALEHAVKLAKQRHAPKP